MAEDTQVTETEEQAKDQDLEPKDQDLEAVKPSRVEKELEAVKAQVQESNLMAKLISDPDFRAVLEAKQRGEKVRVETGEKPTPKVEDQPEVDLDDLPPSKLAKHVLTQVSTMIEQAVERKLGPLSQKVEGVEGKLKEDEGKKVKKEVEALQEKYEDFDLHRQGMMEVNKVNPELSVEELYLIAKARASGGTPKKGPRTETERPSTSSTRPPLKPDKVPNTQEGFRTLLQRALDKQDFKFAGSGPAER